MNSEIQLLLQMIDEAFEKKAWHGANLKGSIRGITAEQALWRAKRNRHNIAEIIIHCAYWKYIVRRRITGKERGSFPLKGSNWIQRNSPYSEKKLKEDITLLKQTHKELRKAIAFMNPKELEKFPKGSTFTNRTTLYGIAQHDVYHAGQIQLLKRLME